MTRYLLLGVLASVVLAAGLLLMKRQGPSLPPARGRAILSAIRAWLSDPVWLGGLGLEIAGYALYVVAVGGAPVSLLAVTMQGGVALFVLFAVVFLGERAGTIEWLGLGGIIAAMLMLGLSLRAGQPEGRVDPLALAALSAAAIVVAALPAALARLSRTGVATALASGVAFGLGSLFTKAMTAAFLATPQAGMVARIAGNPYLYLAIAANLAGLVLMQNAFHRARGLIAMPLSAALSNLVPIVGGIAAFGEHLPTEPAAAALRVGAFALTIAAGACLSLAEQSAAGS